MILLVLLFTIYYFLSCTKASKHINQLYKSS